MRILVAGGAGYIGTFLVPVLIERGYDVEVIDLTSDRKSNYPAHRGL